MAIIKTTQAPSSPGLSLRHSTGGINARVSHRMPNGGVSIRVVVMEFPMPITDITNTHSSEKSLLERQVEAIKKLERQVEAIKKNCRCECSSAYYKDFFFNFIRIP